MGWLEGQAAAGRIPFSMLDRSYLFSDRHLAEIVRMNEMTPASETKDERPHQRPNRSISAPSGSATGVALAYEVELGACPAHCRTSPMTRIATC